MVDEIRVGKVSSIDYKKGMVRILYPDGNITALLPVFKNGDEYKMPKVNDTVLVAHLSSGSCRAVVVGTFWNAASMPPETGEGIYRKDFAAEVGEAFERYDEETKTLHIKADNIILECAAGQIHLSTLLGE